MPTISPSSDFTRTSASYRLPVVRSPPFTDLTKGLVDNYGYKTATENDIQESRDDPSLLNSYNTDLETIKTEIKNLEDAERLRYAIFDIAQREKVSTREYPEFPEDLGAEDKLRDLVERSSERSLALAGFGPNSVDDVKSRREAAHAWYTARQASASGRELQSSISR